MVKEMNKGIGFWMVKLMEVSILCSVVIWLM